MVSEKQLLPTESLKEMFLEAYPQNFTISKTAKTIGVHRRTVFTWLKKDPEFLDAFEDAKKHAIEILEGEVRRRAVEGVSKPIYQSGKRMLDADGKPASVTEYSDVLLMFLLKGAAPEKYRENSQINLHQNQIEVKEIVYNLDLPADKQTALPADQLASSKGRLEQQRILLQQGKTTAETGLDEQ